MDIERGNIEIVFQKIPYMYVIKSQQEMVDYCSYSKMERIFTCVIRQMCFPTQQMTSVVTIIHLCVVK